MERVASELNFASSQRPLLGAFLIPPALPVVLIPGTGSESAEILDGKIHFGLNPEGQDVAGSRFRQMGILSDGNRIASTATGALLLRLYRSADPSLIRRNPTCLLYTSDAADE